MERFFLPLVLGKRTVLGQNVWYESIRWNPVPHLESNFEFEAMAES